MFHILFLLLLTTSFTHASLDKLTTKVEVIDGWSDDEGANEPVVMLGQDPVEDFGILKTSASLKVSAASASYAKNKKSKTKFSYATSILSNISFDSSNPSNEFEQRLIEALRAKNNADQLTIVKNFELTMTGKQIISCYEDLLNEVGLFNTIQRFSIYKSIGKMCNKSNRSDSEDYVTANLIITMAHKNLKGDIKNEQIKLLNPKLQLLVEISKKALVLKVIQNCLLYTSPSPRD